MRTLRMRGATKEGGHGGEVYSCVYTNDGAFVLSAGWDGCLHLWMAATTAEVTTLNASAKPLSCCSITPDGSTWLSGSMEGVLSWWDAVSHQLRQNFLAHIRPVSALQFSPDGRFLATASWDRKLMLRRVGDEREGRALNGHHDIVAGCRWTADSKQLLSWSQDATLRLWDAESARELARFGGHSDRVNCACLSKDGRWAVSGSRDGSIRLWDLSQRIELRSLHLKNEVIGCWCLNDGTSVLTANADGWMVLWSLPDFEVQTELAGNVRAICGDLSPVGNELVLGSEDGRLHFVTIEGVEDAPLLVRPTTTLTKPRTGMFYRILGKQKAECSYRYTCPVCRHTSELPNLPNESIRCAACTRLLRFSADSPELQVQS
jgi:WD40 repeat protein